jgi:hypothetical protein
MLASLGACAVWWGQLLHLSRNLTTNEMINAQRGSENYKHLKPALNATPTVRPSISPRPCSALIRGL